MGTINRRWQIQRDQLESHFRSPCQTNDCALDKDGVEVDKGVRLKADLGDKTYRSWQLTGHGGGGRRKSQE